MIYSEEYPLNIHERACLFFDERAHHCHPSLLINIFLSQKDPKENVAMVEWEKVWQGSNLTTSLVFPN